MAMMMSLKGSVSTSERKILDICEISSEDKEMKDGGCSEEEGEGEREGEGGERSEYELVMAVGHVKEAWMEVPGNLVAHIKVGPSYHLRKEVGFRRYLLQIVSHDGHMSFRAWPEHSGIYSMIFTSLLSKR
jgi:hypothetical protein